MTESSAGTPPPGEPSPPPPRPPAPPMQRPRHDRVFRGVCAALGRATGTDPVLWRVLVVVLTVFGGSGVVLYVAGWLLIPEEGSELSEGQRLLGQEGRNPLLTAVLVGAAVLGVLVVVGNEGQGLVPLVVVGVLAWLVFRERQAGAPAAAGWSAAPTWTSPPPPAATWGEYGTYGPPPGAAHGPPPPPPPPAPRSRLGVLTVSAVALVVGLLLLAGALGVDGVTAARVLAAALLVTGVGLLVGARWGRSRGLVALAVVLAVALCATTAYDQRFGSDTGERTWVVSEAGEYELGAGSATLDLRPLAGTDRAVAVDASIGAGELLVLVPDDLRVDVDASVGLGQLRITDQGRTRESQGGFDLQQTTRLGEAGPADVRLDVTLGLGEVEVRRVEAR